MCQEGKSRHWIIISRAVCEKKLKECFVYFRSQIDLTHLSRWILIPSLLVRQMHSFWCIELPKFSNYLLHCDYIFKLYFGHLGGKAGRVQDWCQVRQHCNCCLSIAVPSIKPLDLFITHTKWIVFSPFALYHNFTLSWRTTTSDAVTSLICCWLPGNQSQTRNSPEYEPLSNHKLLADCVIFVLAAKLAGCSYTCIV